MKDYISRKIPLVPVEDLSAVYKVYKVHKVVVNNFGTIIRLTTYYLPLTTSCSILWSMRIWDVSPSILCRQHLLGEHRELHALWTILTTHRKGYMNHPETKRWVGKLKALYLRHDRLVEEMKLRGYNHHTPLDVKLAVGSATQDVFLHSIEEQKQLLSEKPCLC